MTVSQIYGFANLIPSGTAIATPTTVANTLPAGLIVEWVEWEVPAGPAGCVGFYLATLGNQVVPFASGSPNWIITDNERHHWDMAEQMTSGAWSLVGYNTGRYNHTVYTRYGLYAPPPTSTLGLIPISVLSGP